MGERRELPNTIGSEAGRLLSTSLHAAAQRSCILRWPRVPTSASVSIKAHLVSRIYTHTRAGHRMPQS